MIISTDCCYSEHELERMTSAFESAWSQIGGLISFPLSPEEMRERLALKIVSLVREVPADMCQLRDRAISELGLAVSPAQPLMSDT
jgi:hypothetical protein